MAADRIGGLSGRTGAGLLSVVTASVMRVVVYGLVDELTRLQADQSRSEVKAVAALENAAKRIEKIAAG